jgi:hypothetical protein
MRRISSLPACPKSHNALDVSALEELATEANPFKDEKGIEGRLAISGKRPYRKLYFVPTAKGRRHPEYLKVKRELRDDWDTDITQSDPEKWSWYIQKALRCRMP